jgi:hypothetical protein|tara:strand:- start:28 stop:594 length:567 start_codon:yes stop_codon:yes gene_type:complete
MENKIEVKNILSVHSSEEDRFNLFLFEPSNFFRKIQVESLWKAILIYFIAGGISIVSGYLVNFISMLFMPRMFGGYFSLNYGFVGVIFILLGLCLFFVFGSIIHLMAKVGFKGTAPYKYTMKVLFYSSLPMVVFSFTPIGIFLVIYMFILATIGLAVIHNFSKGKAFAAVIIPPIFIILLIILVGLFL